MEIKKLCSIIGCTKIAEARGYCYTHYKRWQRHGDAESSNRPFDYGARESHPMYQLWGSLRRNRSDILSEDWKNNFWSFVEDVKERPEVGSKISLKRIDTSKKLGRDNWMWTEPRMAPSERESHAAYMRDLRKANPDYFRNLHFKRRYGVTLEWYEAKLVEQDGKCAICRKPETLRIKGKLCRLAVDHCHDSKSARGLLCTRCNRGIGFFNHDKDLLMKAIAYLEKHNGAHA